MSSAGKRGSSKPFDRKVWEQIKKVPEGKVTTYKRIALDLRTGAFRAVGGACNRSPGMPEVPCHRVVAADGRLHGYAHGLDKKRELLESEGVEVIGEGNEMRVDLSRYRV